VGDILGNASVFLLILARCLAMILVLPLFSSRALPRGTIMALAFFLSFLMFPAAAASGFNAAYGRLAFFNLAYLVTLLGEALIGVILGFYVSIIFGAFSTAGQFFSFQTGLGASEVYDALSQVSNPVLGQFLNLMAMLLFLRTGGFQKIFLDALLRSYQSLNAAQLVTANQVFYRFLLSGLSRLFFDAFMLALPVSGTLFLVSVSMGLITKAAPQMNLLSEGLPLTILVTFFVIWNLLPGMCNFFITVFDQGLGRLQQLFISTGGIP
jgi:flagellar biosynthetic protein FliR